jgi:hypothetical protein
VKESKNTESTDFHAIGLTIRCVCYAMRRNALGASRPRSYLHGAARPFSVGGRVEDDNGEAQLRVSEVIPFYLRPRPE